MLLFEHDAKELLAIQGIPVPGGIGLEQAPREVEDATDEQSGPWIVKPQILGGATDLSDRIVLAHTNAEVSAAAASLLDSVIDGKTVHSVWVERQFIPRARTSLCFRCDPESGGIRISVGSVSGETQNAGPMPVANETVVAPTPNAVIDGVEQLSAPMPDEVRNCVAEAGKILAPLYFGYEAILMEIDPLMLLNDGGWAVGNVRLAIDESALFRHPELLSLVERRDYAYRDVRERRRFGFGNRIVDPAGRIATVAAGKGYGDFLIDEMRARGLSPYNVIDAGMRALNGSDEELEHMLAVLDAAKTPQCLLIVLTGDMTDLTQFARNFVATLTARPTFKLPTVVRFVGAGAGAAGAILDQADRGLHVEPALDVALDLTAKYAAEQAE